MRVPSQSHQFAPQSLVQVRRSLGMSQAAMARVLGIPVNSLSRWEIGATVPSAASLAAIYSVAVDNGIAAEFFQPKRRAVPAAGTRSRLVVAWDYRGVPLRAEELTFWWGLMKEYLSARFPAARTPWLLAAFGDLDQGAGQDHLESEGFAVSMGDGEPADRLRAECRRQCAQDPEATALVLVAREGGLADLVGEMAGQGVEVCLWAPDDAMDELVDAVDADHLIRWNEPYVIGAFLILIEGLEGARMTRAQFGNECRRLVGEQPYFDPVTIGFRRRNPYGALLDWLVEQRFVDLRSERDNPNFISVVRRR